MNRIFRLIPILLLLVWVPSQAQDLNRREFYSMERNNARKLIEVPSIDGYVALKCDFHSHTVFSDGEVWPETRVEEAWSDGLDVIAITDHDRYKPKREYLQADNSTPYTIAAEAAAGKGILLVPAVEITRRMPPGHFNALFVTDANLPELQDTSRTAFLTAVEKLHRQGALIVWNHPGWAAQQKDTVKWFPVHETLLNNGWLDGIEVFNYIEWYPVALQWAIDKNLAPFANSDVHGPIHMTYESRREFIRPMTLVFATARTPEALREAILARRTVAWFNGMMAGPADLLQKLFARSVHVGKVQNKNGKTTWQLTNPTDLTLEMKGMSETWKKRALLPPHSAITLTLPDTVNSLPVEVTNWHAGMKNNFITALDLQ